MAYLPYAENVSWTPVVTGATVAGTGTYTAQAGYYTVLGNIVVLQATLVWTAHTGTGNMTVTGLPFACRNSSNYNPEGVCNPENIALPGGATSARVHLNNGQTTLILAVLRSNNTNDPIQMSNAGTLHISLVYLK